MSGPSLPNVGDTLGGKYRIIGRIGEGGMGVVFEAVHVRIQQRVAIKMLSPDVVDVPDVVSRFDREARAAGKLRNDNTVRVLDVDTANGLPFMVMELLDGIDLGQLLEKNGALPIATAVDYVLQACAAMTEAHAAGVVHRDLKPSNLFLTTSGKIKVLDFGISKLENDGEVRVTATQTVVGTPLYMSPEQVRSAKRVDARTDIWSLGIILYELVAGRTPFEGSMTAAAAAICIDAPPPLSQFRAEVPADLERAILTALDKDPTKRYASAQSLADAIAPFGSAGASSAPSSTPMLARELSSARTLPSRPAEMATAPGWTTRSTTAARSRSRTIAIAGGGVALATAALVVVLATRPPRTEAHVAPSAPAASTSTSDAIDQRAAETTAVVAPTIASASVAATIPSPTQTSHAMHHAPAVAAPPASTTPVVARPQPTTAPTRL